MRLRILSVNVSQPKIIAVMDGEPVLSGIGKRPIGRDRVFVDRLNIEGDGQADLAVHGGPDKAVYAYAASHWPWWETEHHLPCSPGTFGENLTLESGDETEICIGDRFHWGDVEMEVAQPRAPCFKLLIHTLREDAAQLMTLAGRCGFYLRVTKEGFAPVENACFERSYASGATSVREAFFAVLGKASAESLQQVRAAPGLAENWASAVDRRLAARPG
ncbi:MAG: MOSC domain-containing protein [Proteobacteria bacterium]|nr:MOSC domain-containing protein [Pseudomonadota bacterium]